MPRCDCGPPSSLDSLAHASRPDVPHRMHESTPGHRRVCCSILATVREIRPAADADAAEWLLRSDVDWWDLVRYGPPGFDVYVRIAFPQDPQADAGNPSGEAPVDAVRAAFTVLGSYTA